MMENYYEHMADNSYRSKYTGIRFEEGLVVHIDAAIESLIPWYLDYEQQNIRLILTALEHRDFSAIERLGDMMKGRGGSYGFHAITNIGRSLEQAAERHNSIEIAELINTLHTYLKIVKIVFVKRR